MYPPMMKNSLHPHAGFPVILFLRRKKGMGVEA